MQEHTAESRLFYVLVAEVMCSIYV